MEKDEKNSRNHTINDDRIIGVRYNVTTKSLNYNSLHYYNVTFENLESHAVFIKIQFHKAERKLVTEGEFTQYPFFSVFSHFCFFLKKYALFHPHFYKSIPHIPDSHILDKCFPKKIFCEGVQLYFEISLLSFIHKIFEQNFYLYTTIYLVRIWTHKNADEKAHYFLKQKQKRKKTDENERKTDTM